MSNIINSDSNIDNPYIVGRPVKNSEMFFGRNDVFGSVLEKLKGQYRDNGIVIYGQSRIGKTSILNQMSSQLSARYLCILVDLHAFKLSDLNGFLWELADHMTEILRDYQIDLPTPNYDMFMKNAQRSFENIFLRQVWSAIGDKHILLMLDEASRLQ